MRLLTHRVAHRHVVVVLLLDLLFHGGVLAVLRLRMAATSAHSRHGTCVEATSEETARVGGGLFHGYFISLPQRLIFIFDLIIFHKVIVPILFVLLILFLIVLNCWPAILGPSVSRRRPKCPARGCTGTHGRKCAIVVTKAHIAVIVPIFHLEVTIICTGSGPIVTPAKRIVVTPALLIIAAAVFSTHGGRLVFVFVCIKGNSLHLVGVRIAGASASCRCRRASRKTTPGSSSLVL